MHEVVEAFEFLVHQAKVRSGVTREILFINLRNQNQSYFKVCLIESCYALCNNTFSKQNQFISLASVFSGTDKIKKKRRRPTEWK